ncbi:hypothetical protein [Amycolatopsis sp. NPDC021455]|uniref:hypothetical protein n=1 Tax=Amycolatopsis sp. NPDC021455 TaxID=3154901 RepID=UPI0033D8640F
MDGYAVKVDELGKLIDDLGTAADRMADANKKLGGGGAFGSLGTEELGKAGVEFEEAWGYGIGRLGEAASGVTERLKQAKQKYERIEAEFGDQLSKFGSAVLGGGGAPVGDRDGKVGGGVTGGVPGINDLAAGKGPGTGGLPGVDPRDPGRGMVGGGVTGGVPGINDLAGDRPGAGITDILNGGDR